MFRAVDCVVCAVCYGTSHGLSHHSTGKVPVYDDDVKVAVRYEKLRQLYTNCTVIQGNLEIVFVIMTNDTIFDVNFLRDIREVTARPALLNDYHLLCADSIGSISRGFLYNSWNNKSATNRSNGDEH